MSTKENKAILRRWYEQGFAKGNLAALDELVATDFVDHNPAAPGLAGGLEGAKEVVTMMRTAFHDFRITVEDMVAEGDKVVARVTARATHKGEFMGIAPTGKQAAIEVIDIVRIAGGKMVERWGIFDQLGLMQKLGAVPPPGQPTK
jgi:steroid delta-isomerase-like uncharacterized protein